MSHEFKYNLETNEPFRFDYDTKDILCVLCKDIYSVYDDPFVSIIDTDSFIEITFELCLKCIRSFNNKPNILYYTKFSHHKLCLKFNFNSDISSLDSSEYSTVTETNTIVVYSEETYEYYDESKDEYGICKIVVDKKPESTQVVKFYTPPILVEMCEATKRTNMDTFILQKIPKGNKNIILDFLQLPNDVNIKNKDSEYIYLLNTLRYKDKMCSLEYSL